MLFGLALVVRLAHVFAMTGSPYFANPVIDAGTFAELARSLAHGHGYPETVFWQPPGYPAFLGLAFWLSGDSYLVPRLLQALLGAISVVLVAWLGARAFGRGVGLGSGLAAALYGMLIYFDAELLAPTVAIALVLAATALGVLARERARRWEWLLAGATGGLAATVVATCLVVPALLAACARRRAPWVLLGTAVALAPVTARNLVRGRELVLISSNGGINFWIGNNPDYQGAVGVRPDLDWRRLVEEPSRMGVSGHGAASRYFTRKALAWAASEPWAFLRLQAHKLRLLLGGGEIYRNQAIYPTRAESPILALLLWKVPGLAFPFGVLLPLSLVGLAVGARRAPLLAVLTGGLALSVLAFFVTARYRLIMVPFLIVFAARAVAWLVAERRWRPRLLAGAALLLLGALSNVGQGAMERKMNADAEYNLGLRLGERGRMREAQALFESAVASRPEYLEAWLNLSVCYDAAGRPGDARAALARAYALDRDAVSSLLRRFLVEGKPDVARRLVEHLRGLGPAAPPAPSP